MARKKSSTSDFNMKEMDFKEAQRVFSRKRGRGSKYDKILDAVEALTKGKALLVEKVKYSEVMGIRSRIKEYLGDDFKVEATKVDKQNDLYDALIHREK